jgi:hypothetical protein
VSAVLGLVVIVLALIGAWTVLRAIARAIAIAERAARAVIADAWRAVADRWRSWVASRDKRRAWRREGIRRLEIETLHALVHELASMHAENAELRAHGAPAHDTVVMPHQHARA